MIETSSAPPIAPTHVETLADVLHRLGDIPPERILWDPFPGTATAADVVRYVDGDNKRLVELIDGILVEKAMSTYSRRVATVVALFIEQYLETHAIGITFGADATMAISPGQIRIPDVSFVSWSKLPERQLPVTGIATLVPDLAVEILSPSNTKREMLRKRIEYFAAGVRTVWEIDPLTQQAEVYSSPEQFAVVDANGELDAGSALPGFKLSMKKLFDRILPK